MWKEVSVIISLCHNENPFNVFSENAENFKTLDKILQEMKIWSECGEKKGADRRKSYKKRAWK